jgi:peptide/nickel transport system permease protein
VFQRKRKVFQRKRQEEPGGEERIDTATPWQLMGRRLRRHRLAMLGAAVLAFFYLVAIFADFLAPFDPHRQHKDYAYAPPQRVHFIDENGFHFRPFVYGLASYRHPETLRKIYVPDPKAKYPLRFFTRGHEYRFWGLFSTDIHLFGVEEGGPMFLMGTDKLGRDLLSRNLYAARISLTIGLIGVGISFVLGCILGGISGYFGGLPDIIIQRVIEFLLCIPTLPLWMGLTAALPKKWSPVATYFGLTVILSVIGWCGLARVVRGKLLALREEDFVTAARLSGASDARIIARHLIPSFMSYLIVSVTLSIPGMILGETALSFLGLGIRAPAISWGVLLNNAQNLRAIAHYPWLLLPGLLVVIVVLAFNFLGDGLRDAADPYK